MGVFLIAHNPGLDFPIKLLNEVCISDLGALLQGPDDELGVCVVVAVFISPEHLCRAVLWHHFLGHQAASAALDDNTLWMQQELNILLALTIALVESFLDVVECFRKEAHGFTLLLDLGKVHARWIFDDEW